MGVRGRNNLSPVVQQDKKGTPDFISWGETTNQVFLFINFISG